MNTIDVLSLLQDFTLWLVKEGLTVVYLPKKIKEICVKCLFPVFVVNITILYINTFNAMVENIDIASKGKSGKPHLRVLLF